MMRVKSTETSHLRNLRFEGEGKSQCLEDLRLRTRPMDDQEQYHRPQEGVRQTLLHRDLGDWGQGSVKHKALRVWGYFLRELQT